MSDPIITSWNLAAERLFGYSSEKIIGTSVAVMSRKDRPEEISGILAKVRAGEHIHHLETNGDRTHRSPASVSIATMAGQNVHQDYVHNKQVRAFRCGVAE